MALPRGLKEYQDRYNKKMVSLILILFDSIMNQEDACNSHLCEEAVELRKINESSPKLLNEDFFRSHQLVHCLSSFLDV